MAADIDLAVAGVKGAKGEILVCLTRRSDYLKCDKDPARVAIKVPAARATAIELPALAPGRYGLLVVHDANGNGKLDTFAGLPREGFGFSNNPGLTIGPPSWRQVAFDAAPGRSRRVVKLLYLL